VIFFLVIFLAIGPIGLFHLRSLWLCILYDDA
jgi:hypothetical protein